MIDNKIFWLVLAGALALLSGCLSREAQNALVGQVPYGLGSLATSQYGVPQRGYTSALNSANGSKPSRGYTSKIAAAGGWGGNIQGMECLQNIDQAEMERFSQQAQQVDAQIKSLCAQGLRDKAMQQAIAFGKKMASSKVMQDLKKCGESARGMVPSVADAGYNKKHHICDG